MERAIITGGTGFIGSKLAANLLHDGYEVVVLSRNPKQHRMPEGIILTSWDGRSAEGWGDYANGATVIYNLAGASLSSSHILPARWTDERKREIENSRLRAGQAVTEAVTAARERPDVVVQMSGTDYYPYGDDVVTESGKRGYNYLASVVADYWEGSTIGIDDLGVRRIIARTAPLLNLENGPLPPSLLQFRLFVGGRLGSGKQWLSWIHADDAVKALQFLAEHETAAGPVNVVAPHPVTNQEYTDTLASILGRPALIPVPAFALRTALGEVADLVLEGRPVSAAQLEALGYHFQFPRLEPALRDILS